MIFDNLLNYTNNAKQTEDFRNYFHSISSFKYYDRSLDLTILCWISTVTLELEILEFSIIATEMKSEQLR